MLLLSRPPRAARPPDQWAACLGFCESSSSLCGLFSDVLWSLRCEWHLCSLQRNCLGWYPSVRNHFRTVTRLYFSNCSRSSKLEKGKKNMLPSFGMNYCTAGVISWCEMKLELRSCWLWNRGSDLEGLPSLGATCVPLSQPGGWTARPSAL